MEAITPRQRQRDLNPALDDAVFSPRKEIAHGSQTSYAEKKDGQFVFTAAGPRRQGP